MLFGPYMHNFASLAHDMRESGGGIEITDSHGLAEAWSRLLSDERRRLEIGARARQVALRDATAGLRTARVVADRLCCA